MKILYHLECDHDELILLTDALLSRRRHMKDRDRDEYADLSQRLVRRIGDLLHPNDRAANQHGPMEGGNESVPDRSL